MSSPAESPSSAAARRRRTVILSGIAGVLAVVVIAATAMVVTMRPGGGAATPEVDLASVSEVGPNPFAALTNATAAPASVTRVDTSTATPASGAVQLAGSTPGLYAGSDGSRCDPAALARYLGSDFTRAQAWASVFGISADQIPYFLNTLTPVTLTADTWVTNHSWASGVARPFQSVLQAGTPVLVDSEGVPRVRCACGNPLAPPSSAPLSGFRTSGSAWPEYRTTRVVHVRTTNVSNTTIVQAPPAGQVQVSAPLTVRDPATGGLVQQAFSALLNLASLPPLTKPLPTAASMNVPFRSSDPAVAQENGVTTQGVALPEMTRAAAEVSVPDAAIASETVSPSSAALPVPSTDSSAVPAPVVTPPTTSASESVPPPIAPVLPTTAATTESTPSVPATPPSTSTSSSTSAGPTPTVFSGSGSTISGFSFAGSGGTSVRCSVQVVTPTAVTPTTEAAPTSVDPSSSETPTATATTTQTPTDATVTCSDGTSATVSVSSLSESSVRSATDSTGVWTVSLDGRSVPVTAATWN